MNDHKQLYELCDALDSLAPDVAILRSNAATPALNNLDESTLLRQWYDTGQRLMINMNRALDGLAGLRLQLLHVPYVNEAGIDHLRRLIDYTRRWGLSIEVRGQDTVKSYGSTIRRDRDDEPTTRSLDEFQFSETANEATAFAAKIRAYLLANEVEGRTLPPKQPSNEAWIAWRLRTLSGIAKQTEIAKLMSAELNKTIKQWRVSRWLSEVDEFFKAGGNMPPLPDPSRSKPVVVDPAVLDYGERKDRRTKAQRQRREDSDD